MSRYETGKHFDLTITDDSLSLVASRTGSRPKPPGRVLRIAAAIPASQLDALAMITTYRT